ncbi:MAG: UbiD family decarboxylase [Steroidobacteraceae bacterium]|nr:UbiD family decarboxylase [Steroidobacteraceae bacterium]MDW8258523.1 UbiD family decarboxylase [Gammaproteobacteria bacterium]
MRTYLERHAAAVWRLREPVDARYELTALQHELDRSNRYPIILATQVQGSAADPLTRTVVTNLTASRTLTAAALGIDDHRQAAAWFAGRAARGVEPCILPRGSGACQQLVLRGAEVDLTRLPVLTPHELEPGPYLTAAHATTFDPDTGIDNCAIQRCWVQGPRQMTWFPYPSSHNMRNLRKFWQRGAACPVAFWIGHHPAVLLGSQAKLGYPESHWRAAGGILGEALRLVPSMLHGERILVPADAEIVIEGFAPPDQMTADGPFGEYTGYLGPQVAAPRVEVECLTLRRDALYHDYGSGLADALVPDNLAMEGRLYQLVKPVAPSLQNVHVPTAGRRFHAYLQLRDPARGEARDALAAALAYRRVKAVVAVDDDIDIFDPQSLCWAVATRVQWSRDTVVIEGLSTSTLDPSLPHGAQTAAKIGIDATLPPAPRPGLPRAVPPVARVPLASASRARERLAAATGTDRWPTV